MAAFDELLAEARKAVSRTRSRTPRGHANVWFSSGRDAVVRSAYAAEVGFPEKIIERGERAAEMLPEGLVYAGFSLGVLPAQNLAQTRPGARGALLFYWNPAVDLTALFPSEYRRTPHAPPASVVSERWPH